MHQVRYASSEVLLYEHERIFGKIFQRTSSPQGETWLFLIDVCPFQNLYGFYWWPATLPVPCSQIRSFRECTKSKSTIIGRTPPVPEARIYLPSAPGALPVPRGIIGWSCPGQPFSMTKGKLRLGHDQQGFVNSCYDML